MSNLDNYITHPFTKFNKDWGILTAGTDNDFNSMTISWGGMGTIWNKSVVFLFVKETRYTYEFLQKHDELTVSFYHPKYRKELSFYGSKSGRDYDKDTSTGFTPKIIDGSVTYKEANETLVCRKIFMQKLEKDKFPKFALDYYQGKELPAHTFVIAEIIDKC